MNPIHGERHLNQGRNQKGEEAMIKETNVTLMVSDMERSVRFYSNTLGLKVKARYGDHFAQIESPGTIIALHPATKGGPKPGESGSISIGFSVDDLDKATAELTKKGVIFSGTTDDAQVRLAFFADPDGNPLYLSQNKWS